jgi:hypothetical protein
MTKPRFLLDENVNRAIQRQLRRLDSRIDVIGVDEGDAPQAGASDEEILCWIEVHGYILITRDRRTVPVHLHNHFSSGHEVPGIFWIRPDAEIGSIIECLYLIWEACEAEEHQNKSLYIPL